MKIIISSILLLFLFSFNNCKTKKNEIGIYFNEIGFSFPNHLIKSKPRFYDINEGKYITGFKENDFLAYTEQSFQLLKNDILDKDLAFVLEKPIVYLADDDTLFSIGVSTYKLNIKKEKLPCSGCEPLVENKIWRTGNRAIFKFDKITNRLVFKDWEN